MTEEIGENEDALTARMHQIHNDIAAKNVSMLMKVVKTTGGDPADLIIILETIVAGCFFLAMEAKDIERAVKVFTEDLPIRIKEMQDKYQELGDAAKNNDSGN